MTRTADALALLRACAQFPDDDTPRLMYADCLEENGDGARAEFVRHQCELARCHSELTRPCGSKWCLHPGCALHLRAYALLRENEARWRAAGPCPKCTRGRVVSVPGKHGIGWRCEDCFGTGDRGGLMQRDNDMRGRNAIEYPWRHHATFVRGFVVRVECPRLADALAEADVTCEACKGTGCGEPVYAPITDTVHADCGGRLTRPPNNPDHRSNDKWCERCWAVVSARHIGFEDCRQCGNTGKVRRLLPTPWLRAVLDATAAPERALVAEVVPLCREPTIGSGFSAGKFGWCTASGLGEGFATARVPDPLIELMSCVLNEKGVWRWFDTPEAAVSALGRAIVALARA